MSEKETVAPRAHALSLLARESAHIEGVCEVESFDEQSVVLLTDCGELVVEGEELHVCTLDVARGVVEIKGKIGALLYADRGAAKRGLRARRSH